MSIQKVVLIGANGHLGPSILQALLSQPQFIVSVLTRASSKSTYPSNVNVLTTDDSLPHAQLVTALTGQDALIIAFAGTQKDQSIALANAAFDAGIKHIIPADFGSCDSSDPKSLDLIPLYVKKKEVREHLIQLSQKSRPSDAGTRTMSWTSLVTGHFFDYGLKSGLLAIDLDKNFARIFDGGEYKFAATTLADIGYATVQILVNVENPLVRNQLVYVQSVQTTQNELIRVVEEVRGKKLEVQSWKSEQFIRETKAELEQKPGDHHLTEMLVEVGGIVNTDWSAKGNAFVNDLFGMPRRELKALVVEALR